MIRQLLASSLLVLGALSAGAQVLVYSNTTTFSGGLFSNDGATLISGNTITRMVADDLNLGLTSGNLPVLQYSLSFANGNTVSVSARPRVRFFAADGVNGGPGSFLYGASFNATTLTASSEIVFNSALRPISSPYFIVPADGKVWAGLVWDNNTGATGASIAQLNLLGMGIYNPPTIGGSTNSIFLSSSAGSFLSANPAGSLIDFGGDPIANLGWRIAVPEPSTYAAILGALVLGFVAIRRRR